MTTTPEPDRTESDFSLQIRGIKRFVEQYRGELLVGTLGLVGIGYLAANTRATKTLLRAVQLEISYKDAFQKEAKEVIHTMKVEGKNFSFYPGVGVYNDWAIQNAHL